jgi:hypothetical protein
VMPWQITRVFLLTRMLMEKAYRCVSVFSVNG